MDFVTILTIYDDINRWVSSGLNLLLSTLCTLLLENVLSLFCKVFFCCIRIETGNKQKRFFQNWFHWKSLCILQSTNKLKNNFYYFIIKTFVIFYLGREFVFSWLWRYINDKYWNKTQYRLDEELITYKVPRSGKNFQKKFALFEEFSI